jgi:hypothetical protein
MAHTFSQVGFTLKQPPGWKAVQGPGGFLRFVNPNPDQESVASYLKNMNLKRSQLDAQQIKNVEDMLKTRVFHATINVVYETMPRGGIKQYLDHNKAMLESSTHHTLEEYNRLGEKEVTVHGLKGYSIEGNFKAAGQRMRNMQLLVVNENIAYWVTATALDAVWKKYKSLFTSTLTSFKIDSRKKSTVKKRTATKKSQKKKPKKASRK